MVMLLDMCTGMPPEAKILRRAEKRAKIADIFHSTLIMVPGRKAHVYTIDA
jgi:hypothetical protein